MFWKNTFKMSFTCICGTKRSNEYGKCSGCGVEFVSHEEFMSVPKYPVSPLNEQNAPATTSFLPSSSTK